LRRRADENTLGHAKQQFSRLRAVVPPDEPARPLDCRHPDSDWARQLLMYGHSSLFTLENPMTPKSFMPPRHLFRALTASLAVVGAMSVCTEARAVLTLNASGIADGFSLSTFYTDPAVSYGLLGAVSAPGGFAIGSGYARGQIYKFNNVDGQTFGSALQTVSVNGTPTAIASTAGQVYVGLLGGRYYSVNPTNLALTLVPLPTTVAASYGLWGNQSNGHLLAGTNLGLLDINPVTGTYVLIGSPGGNIDGVTVSPDGSVAYIETNNNRINGYSVITPNPTVPVFSAINLLGGPDGTGVISGGAFSGDLIVNNNDGTVGLLNHITGVETIIATGGTRGDLVAPDTSNGTLFLSSFDRLYRLSCGDGCGIGSVAPPVPEPTTVSLLALGLVGLWMRRRHQKT
jgi:hypothetical protein